MTPEERVEYAKRILENPLWEETISRVRDDLQRGAERAGMADHELHQSIILSFQLLKKFELHFTTAMTSDRVTQFNLEQRKKVT